ncbi:endogenous retrovirus group V member 2 Env polyprotein-like [Indicator indicator]|uniref:endogenous retrovirus group V member 2 Env polyprotein-like n=1 Tax=Indicator indicator TaxID=1002788 RepID=UPI0023DFDFF8|nr:endogenous retrovirus group V member 2 Env polyprotein-like [Indicator indicator]
MGNGEKGPKYELLPWDEKQEIKAYARCTDRNITRFPFGNRHFLKIFELPSCINTTKIGKFRELKRRLKQYYDFKKQSYLNQCKMAPGWWWLCGDGYARKSLPENWEGHCVGGQLIPQYTIHNEITTGIVRSPWRRVKRVLNPLIERPTGFHSFVRWLIPMIGVSELEKAIVNISASMEIALAATEDAIRAEQKEIESLHKITGQFKYALDILFAKEGGLCTIVNDSCCTYVNEEKKIEMDLHKIWEQSKVFHEVSRDDISYGFSNLWEKLTSWMPNIFWLKQLLVGIVMIIILIVLIVVLIKVIMCIGKSDVKSYERYKNDKLRHELETGNYFKKI